MADSLLEFLAKQEVAKEDLKQYGVMGMKWGKRRPRGKDGLVKGGPSREVRALPARVKLDKPLNLRKSPKKPPQFKALPAKMEGNSAQLRAIRRAAESRDRPTHKLTDDELKSRLARAELERRYEAIMALPAKGTTRPPAIKFVGDVLATSGKTVAIAYATKYLDTAAANLLKTEALTSYNKQKKNKNK